MSGGVGQACPKSVFLGTQRTPDKVLAEYQDHYNAHRPHRSRDQRPPEAPEQPPILPIGAPRMLLRTRILGGVINKYQYAA